MQLEWKMPEDLSLIENLCQRKVRGFLIFYLKPEVNLKDDIIPEVQGKLKFVEEQVSQVKQLKERFNQLIFKKTMLSKAKGFLRQGDFQEMVR